MYKDPNKYERGVGPLVKGEQPYDFNMTTKVLIESMGIVSTHCFF